MVKMTEEISLRPWKEGLACFVSNYGKFLCRYMDMSLADKENIPVVCKCNAM